MGAHTKNFNGVSMERECINRKAEKSLKVFATRDMKVERNYVPGKYGENRNANYFTTIL